MVFGGDTSRDIAQCLVDPKSSRYIPSQLVSLDSKVTRNDNLARGHNRKYEFSFKILTSRDNKHKSERKTHWYRATSLRDVLLVHYKMRMVRYMAILTAMKEGAAIPTRRSARLNDLNPDLTEQMLAAAIAVEDRTTVATMIKDLDREMKKLATCTIHS